MGLYGMTSGQALGQGTFTFDRIVPNRYLLDSRVNNDSVMPGRYALIEYDRPVAVIDDINNFTYKEGSKAYDIIPVKNGVINIAEGVDCIFVCVMDANNNNLYQYYYYNLSNGSITPYASPMIPNEFNKIVDRAYIAKDVADNIDSEAFDLWDSTAWIKIIDKEKSEFKYIKIADLNVLTPTFTVDTNTSHEPTTTFSDTRGTFNVPSVTQGQNASFVIKFPPPMNIDVAVETTAGTGQDTIVSSFKDKNTKKFTFKLPSVGKAVNNIKDFIKINSWPDTGNKPSYNISNYNSIPNNAGTVWQVIKDAYASAESANNATSEANAATVAANQAASAANTAAENVGDNIKDVFSSGQVTVDWSISQATSAGANVEIPIANKPTIIKAEDINNLWG